MRDIVGTDGVLDRPGDLAPYAQDGSGGTGTPEAAVLPRKPEEVAAVLRLASGEGVPVTPRGAGTGLRGLSVPREGGIVLSTARMDRVVSVSEEDLIAVAEPGVVTDKFQAQLEERGLFYPPDRASPGSTLGGDVGESASGLRALKYGSTRNYVMGMVIALPTGEIVRTGARTLKCVTGYDLARLVVGSGGTLGVCTELYLKILPSPEVRVTIVAAFDTAARAAQAASRILEEGGIPSALELLDRRTVRALEGGGFRAFPGGSSAFLLAETDGLPAQAERQAARVEEGCRSSGATDFRRLESLEETGRVWKARKWVVAALSRLGPSTVLEDLRTPRSRVSELVGFLERLAEEEDVPVAVFGHVGEGRLHPAIAADLTDPAEAARIERTVERISDRVLSLGGTLGPERGVGLGGVSFLKRRGDPKAVDLSKRLKEVFDPAGIMNPGKVL